MLSSDSTSWSSPLGMSATCSEGATGGLRLTERFTRVADDTVRYEVTVSDPETFSRPWTAALSLRTDSRLPDVFEYACHEGNYAMRNILSAAREAEQAAQDGTAR